MRRLAVVLDASDAASYTGGDFRPNPLLFVVDPLRHFFRAFLERNTLGAVSLYAARDGVCSRLCAATSSAVHLTAALEAHFALPGARGAFSLENVIGSLRAYEAPEDDFSPELAAAGTVGLPSTSSSGGAAAAAPGQSRVSGVSAAALVITASSASIDASDVLKAIDGIAGKSEGDAGGAAGRPQRPPRLRVDVISMLGAPRVFQLLADATGGRFMCPLQPPHFAGALLKIAQPSWISDGSRAGPLVEGAASAPAAASAPKPAATTAVPPPRVALVMLVASPPPHATSAASSSNAAGARRGRDGEPVIDVESAGGDATATVPSTVPMVLRCAVCATCRPLELPSSCAVCGVTAVDEGQARLSRLELRRRPLVVVALPDDAQQLLSPTDVVKIPCAGSCGRHIAAFAPELKLSHHAGDKAVSASVASFGPSLATLCGEAEVRHCCCPQCAARFCLPCSAEITTDTIGLCPACLAPVQRP